MRNLKQASRGSHVARSIASFTVAFSLFLVPANASLLDGAPREAITTSIKDALPVAQLLGRFLQGITPVTSRSTRVPSGYFRMRLQSYCLHAGTYGPTKGDGYLLAPLKGDRALLIRSIMERSFAHPEIQQQDIQQLIWGIEAYTPFQDYASDFQNRIRPLLTSPEISAMSANRESVKNVARGLLGSLIPAQITNTISQVQSWRDKITNPALAFPELEQLAVLRGKAPIGEGSREVPAGPWSYAENGTYVRFFPESYSTTDVEVFRPPSYSITLDDIGRATHLSSGGYTVDATYAARPDVTSIRGAMVRSWRFKTLRLTGPKQGQTALFSNRGYVLDSRDVAYGKIGNTALSAPRTPIQVASLNMVRVAITGDNAVNITERALTEYSKFGTGKDAREAAGPEPNAQVAGSDLTGAEHLAGGLHDIVAGNPYYWIGDTYAKVAIIAAGAAAKLEGKAKDAPANDVNSQNNYDYPLLAEPANTSQQRLGVSGRGAQ